MDASYRGQAGIRCLSRLLTDKTAARRTAAVKFARGKQDGGCAPEQDCQGPGAGHVDLTLKLTAIEEV